MTKLLKLDNIVEKEDVTLFNYTSEFYNLKIRAFKEGFIIGNVTATKGDYTPAIQLDDDTCDVFIQTTSYGAKDTNSIEEIVTGYNNALKVVPEIKSLLATYKMKTENGSLFR